MFKKIKDFTITSKEKAVVAGIVSAIATYLVANGLTVTDILTWQGFWAMVAGVVVHQATYWTSNSSREQ